MKRGCVISTILGNNQIRIISRQSSEKGGGDSKEIKKEGDQLTKLFKESTRLPLTRTRSPLFVNYFVAEGKPLETETAAIIKIQSLARGVKARGHLKISSVWGNCIGGNKSRRFSNEDEVKWSPLRDNLVEKIKGSYTGRLIIDIVNKKGKYTANVKVKADDAKLTELKNLVSEKVSLRKGTKVNVKFIANNESESKKAGKRQLPKYCIDMPVNKALPGKELPRYVYRLEEKQNLRKKGEALNNWRDDNKGFPTSLSKKHCTLSGAHQKNSSKYIKIDTSKLVEEDLWMDDQKRGFFQVVGTRSSHLEVKLLVKEIPAEAWDYA